MTEEQWTLELELAAFVKNYFIYAFPAALRRVALELGHVVTVTQVLLEGNNQ